MRLILARHGETIWNRERRVQGHSDIDLSETGREQASRLARALQFERIDAIYASPLRRAQETAQIVGEFHPVPIQSNPGLSEMNHGDFEGLSFGELRDRFGPFLKVWMQDPSAVRMPNGETLAELQGRAWLAVTEIAAHCENALVVSHNFAITSILCKIQRIELHDFRKVRVDLASRTVVHFREGRAEIEVMNDTSHLVQPPSR